MSKPVTVTVTRTWTMQVGSTLCFPSPTGRSAPTYAKVTKIVPEEDLVEFTYQDGSKDYDFGIGGLAQLVDLDPEIQHDDVAEQEFAKTQGAIQIVVS